MTTTCRRKALSGNFRTRILSPRQIPSDAEGVNSMKKVQVTGTTRTRALTRKW